jgi:hypothetical protein
LREVHSRRFKWICHYLKKVNFSFIFIQFRTLNVWKRPCMNNGNYSKCIERCFVAAAADRMTCRLPFMDEISGWWTGEFSKLLFLIFKWNYYIENVNLIFSWI